MASFSWFKRLRSARGERPATEPAAPLEIVEHEIELCRARIADARAVLQTLEGRAMQAVRAGQDETAAQMLAEVSSIQEHILAEQAALLQFEEQRANLHTATRGSM